MRFFCCLLVLALAFTFVCQLESVYAQNPNQDRDDATKIAHVVPREPTDDPLVAKDIVTLEDIQQGIENTRRRSTVIDLHFKRVDSATFAEKQDFLLTALKSEFPEVQRQAARELAALGLLEGIVRDVLIGFLQSDDPKLRQAAVIALEQIDYKNEDWSNAYWDALIEGLASPDHAVVQGIVSRIEGQESAAIPMLIKALNSPVEQVQREAAKLLSRCVGSKPSNRRSMQEPSPVSEPTSLDADTVTKLSAGSRDVRAGHSPSPQNAGTMSKAPSAKAQAPSARTVDVAKPQSVRVYFGTNRELIPAEQPPWSKILLYPVLSLILLLGIAMIWWRPRESERRGCFGFLTSALFLVGMVWTLGVFRSELLDRWRIGTGPRYGPRRDSKEQVHYGTCDVSIPPKHERGVIETPVIGPEDESLHVVLKKTEEMEEKAFFEAVQAKVAALPKEQRSCFVFIHGFNVTFENAAKRTAQIHYDLEFSGVPIFFSWPSRASVRHYFSDRNEIEFSRYVIKQFLLDVSQRVNADRIHVIAHSMGADATCRAIAELGERGKIFDQIILAAPDIDREVFRLQLAPRMTLAANRTTLYCSKNDMALLASNTFNDGPRAGDSSHGVLVAKELDTIDASGIDTALLGHSYYGDCLPILNDVRKMVSKNLSPKERNLLAWPVEHELTYWTLIEQRGTVPELVPD
jgi:esterase/lipase superfamily enzyme